MKLKDYFFPKNDKIDSMYVLVYDKQHVNDDFLFHTVNKPCPFLWPERAETHRHGLWTQILESRITSVR